MLSEIQLVPHRVHLFGHGPACRLFKARIAHVRTSCKAWILVSIDLQKVKEASAIS